MAASLAGLFASPGPSTYAEVLALADEVSVSGSAAELHAFVEEAHERLRSLPLEWRKLPRYLYQPWLAPVLYDLSDVDVPKRTRFPDVPLPNLERIELGKAATIDWTQAPDAAWPSLRTLRILSPGPRALPLLEWLVRQRLPALRELELEDVPIDTPLLKRLQAVFDWSRLERLHIRRGRLTGGLGDWPASIQLRSLLLAVSELGDQGVAALADCDAPGLERLCIYRNPIGEGFTAVTRLRAPRLRQLEFRGCQTSGAAAWRRLAESNWSQLTALDVQIEEPSPSGAMAAALARFPSLRHLNLSSCGLEVGAGAELATVPLERLESLGLAFNRLGAADVAALARAELPSLRDLDLRSNSIGSHGLEDLVHAPWWPRLRRLGLLGAGLDASGIQALVSAPSTSLRTLDLGFDPDAEARQRLLSAFPSAELNELHISWSIDGRPVGYGETVAAALAQP